MSENPIAVIAVCGGIGFGGGNGRQVSWVIYGKLCQWRGCLVKEHLDTETDTNRQKQTKNASGF